MTPTTIQTDNLDLIAYHTKEAGQLPPLRFDTLIGKVIAEISQDSRDAFQLDAELQRYLSVKTAVWKAVSEIRNRGRR